MGSQINFEIKEDFKKAIDDAVKIVGDLSVPLKTISQRWYKSNKSIFTLKGPGQYEDLSEKYKNRKQLQLGFTYPALLGPTGRIRASITDPSDQNAIREIGKKDLILGVKINSAFPYPRAHHLGSPRQNIPARPFLFTGAEQIKPSGHRDIIDIYKNIISDFVIQKVRGVLP